MRDGCIQTETEGVRRRARRRRMLKNGIRPFSVAGPARYVETTPPTPRKTRVLPNDLLRFPVAVCGAVRPWSEPKGRLDTNCRINEAPAGLRQPGASGPGLNLVVG